MFVFNVRVDADFRLWSGIFNGILQQINQYPFEQRAIDVNESQRRGQGKVYRMNQPWLQHF